VEKSFSVAYKELNDAQRKAVDAIDGPVLVIAGPGTGKTQLLSLRVANILKQTDSDPGSILCLTFTNFAAINMRERLNTFLGSNSRNIRVRTFHSFAAELMQLNPDYFWNGARLTNVPDAVQLDIIQSILAELPLDNPLAVKFAGNYTSLNDVKQGLKLAKEAGLTPEKLRAMIEANLAYIKEVAEPALVETLDGSLSMKHLDELESLIQDLPEQNIEQLIYPLQSLSSVIKAELSRAIEADKLIGKTTNSGKWKRKWLQNANGTKGMFDEIKRNNWWLCLSEVYETYRKYLHERDYYDYSDMIIEVLSVLEQNPDLLASIQESFLYVLIDEFQDANKAQIRLSQLVASDSANPSQPNLMAVGDDDQSIFAFNGAELNNMLNFEKAYPETKKIVLTNNYRSSQAILDTAKSIINQADERLVNILPELDKNLVAQAKLDPGEIIHFRYPTKEHQLFRIAESIKQAWQNDHDQSLVVLARSHDSLRQISYYLQEANVPIRYEQQNNILDQRLIQQLLLLAETVVAINQGNSVSVNYNLRRLLSDPTWRVSPKELWHMAVTNYAKRTNWLDSLNDSDKPKLVVLGQWLMWLAAQSVSEKLPIMIEYLIGHRPSQHMTSPLRESYITSAKLDSEYLSSLSGLNILRDLVYEFVASHSQNVNLTDFVRFIDLNNELGRQIVDESWFISNEKAVELMTVHKAKGLEFDTVYILDGVENQWQPRHIGRKPPANLPLQPYGEDFNDYARLAYVAATRSRRTLVVSSYMTDQKGQKVLASPLFNEFPVKEYTEADESQDSKQMLLEASLSWPRLNTSDEKSLLTPRLKDYKLSATGLLRFLDVSQGGPEHFLETELLRLPEITSAHMAYGTAMHTAMQTAQNLINNDRYKLEEVKAAYSNKLSSLAIPSDVLERYLPHGQDVIDNLFKNLKFSMEKNGQAEVAINDIKIEGVALSGTLDHVYFRDGHLTITDYKTGSPLSSFTTRDQTKAIKAWRNRTQLLFYCLMAEASNLFRPLNNITAQIIYLEAEEPKQLTLSLQPDREELEKLKQLIAIVGSMIKDLNLIDTSNYPKTIEGINQFTDDLLQNKTALQ
jgi:DNA helicase-2/ATP-dependent DNA helicase PcrA